MVPGVLQLGDSLVVEGSLCLAKVREVEHAPLRSVQASTRLHAWEDRRLLGAWAPQAGCFARLASSEATPPLSMRCVPLVCGPLAASSCAVLGMQSSCIEPEGAWAQAVREPLHVATAARTARLSVTEAAQAMRRLCESPLLGAEEPQRHGAAREVWRAQLEDARGAWRASERDLAAHLTAQLLSVRHGRLVQLGSRVSHLLGGWLDGPVLVAALGAWADGLLAFVNASGSGDAVDEGDERDSAGAGVEAGVEAVARPQWGVLLHQLGLDTPTLSPSPSAAQLKLIQLTVETAAQLEAAQLWLHAISATRQLHIQLGSGCTPATQLASVTDYQLSAANSSLHGWRVALQPLSPKGGALEAAEQCLRQKASEVLQLASGFGTGAAPGLGAGVGHTGFAPCRELHGFAPLLALSLDHEGLAADDFGLSHTQAASRQGERWLRYHPLAGTIREESGGSQRTYLELHMNSTFDAWPDSPRRRALTWQGQPASGQPAPHPTEAHRSTVPRRAAAPTPPKLSEARRRRLDGCSADDCSVDMWCDSDPAAIDPVGAGYYSPAGDCARYACTNMEEEYKPSGGGPTYTASGNGSDACPWACGAGWGGVDLPCPSTTRSGLCRRCMAMMSGLWSPATSNAWVTCGCEEHSGSTRSSEGQTRNLDLCDYGLKAVLRGDAVWTSVRSLPAATARTSAHPWPHLRPTSHPNPPPFSLLLQRASQGFAYAEPTCPFLCTTVDLYQRTDISPTNTPVIDCVKVPPGYYSAAQDNAWHACSSPFELPQPLQTFTTRGNGTDNCTVSPQLQAFLPPAPDDPLAQPLRPPLTAEAWFEWGDTPSQPVSIMGATPFWHLSLQLAVLPTAFGTQVAIEMHLVDAAQGAAVNATLPWVRRDRWHHVAAVCTNISCCYFLDGAGFGCAPWSNRTSVSPEEPALHTPAPAVFVGGTHGLRAAGFPPGFVEGKLAEVRLHTRALEPTQLGFRLSDLALTSSCAEPDEMCNGRCVAGCAGDSQLNASTCSCDCARGESLDPASGRCVAPCGAGMGITSVGACGCDASSFEVWRGRYLGISSPSTEPDFASHSWHHAAEQVGLAEVHLLTTTHKP